MPRTVRAQAVLARLMDDPTSAEAARRVGARTELRPEERLLGEVLRIAHADLWSRSAGDRWRARCWFQSPARSWPCAYLSICEALGLDADWTRRQCFAHPPPLPAGPRRRADD